MSKTEESCGTELAASSDIPEQFGSLFAHVAQNLRAHARWVGDGDTECKQEQDALIAAAAAYESVSSVCARTAELLRSFATLPPAPHDVAQWDRPAWEAWMRTKIQIQRSLAATLAEHADQSEEALAGHAH
jgi:hypothetical protein